MSRLVWDAITDRMFKTGVDLGVLYPLGKPAEVWNGLTSVNESEMSNSDRDSYIDGVKYRKTAPGDSFEGLIKAITFPESFGEGIFGLSYRVMTSDLYELHLVYNALATPTSVSYISGGAEVIPQEFSWKFSTKPLGVPDARPSAHLIIDAARTYPWVLSQIEDVLYGSSTTDARLPSPSEVVTLFEAGAMLRVIDNGDGTATFIGRTDEVVHMIDATTAEISWSSVVYLDAYSCRISSF